MLFFGTQYCLEVHSKPRNSISRSFSDCTQAHRSLMYLYIFIYRLFLRYGHTLTLNCCTDNKLDYIRRSGHWHPVILLKGADVTRTSVEIRKKNIDEYTASIHHWIFMSFCLSSCHNSKSKPRSGHFVEGLIISRYSSLVA